ncbi:HAD family hydrolase [Devosia sp. MC1541]|uniref:HAD family hydrolase n=1 Tax=Devosia sp. MC1541 TaxID=2725264 RepID=UPI00145EC87F|nr:HAD family hydrolase [Devosia sp. MC1541]
MSRAIVFDIDGVLIEGMNHDANKSRRWDVTLKADMGIDPKRFTDEFIFDIFVTKVTTGKMSVIEALDKRLPSLGYKGSTMKFLDYWLKKDSVLNQPLIDAIRDFRAKNDNPFYIATNQEHIRAVWLWSNTGLGDIFDDMFHSARTNARKPEKAYFDFISGKIGPQSEPPLFFDDTPKIVDGARKAGWEAMIYDRLESFTTHPWIAARL